MIRVFEKMESVWSEEFEEKVKGKIVSFNWTLYFNWDILEEVLDNADQQD